MNEPLIASCLHVEQFRNVRICLVLRDEKTKLSKIHFAASSTIMIYDFHYNKRGIFLIVIQK